MAPLDNENVMKMINHHQTQCVRVFENNLENIVGTLNSLANKMDVMNNRIGDIAVNNATIAERLRSGSGHFEVLDNKINEHEKKIEKLQMNLLKVTLIIAASGGVGAALMKMFINI